MELNNYKPCKTLYTPDKSSSRYKKENKRTLNSLHYMAKLKAKAVLPSLKEKRRYLVYEAITEGTTSFPDTKEAILKETSSFLGRLGQAKAGIEILDDWHENRGIIKVSTTHLDQLKASLVMLRKINKKEAIIRSVGVSGTINKARNKFIAQ